MAEQIILQTSITSITPIGDKYLYQLSDDLETTLLALINEILGSAVMGRLPIDYKLSFGNNVIVSQGNNMDLFRVAHDTDSGRQGASLMGHEDTTTFKLLRDVFVINVSNLQVGDIVSLIYEPPTPIDEHFLDKLGLTYLWSKLKAYFQDKLVSGTNIRTINNQSLLGSGNIEVGGGTVDTEMSDLSENAVQNKVIKSYIDTNIPSEATDSNLGLIKLNSSESITLNSDGQLDVGGRLGQFSGTTGIYHSKDREPRKVGDFTLLITDAKGMESAGPRNFTLMTGNNLSLNGSHAAGSTQYKVANNYANRIICAGIKYIALNEASAKQTQVIKVTSVTIGGSAYTPSSANDSSNPIIINTEASVNPSSAITQIRVFSAIGTGSYCSEYVGQCVGGDAGGDGLAIGQNVFNKSGNMNAMVGQSIFNTGNGNAIFGRQHISRKNRSFLAGTGHDTTNARSESVSALGEWSDLSSSETLFAIGDGTSHIDRSNAFEVRDQCIVLKSPNGTKWKITVDNSGNLITTAI